MTNLHVSMYVCTLACSLLNDSMLLFTFTLYANYSVDSLSITIFSLDNYILYADLFENKH